MTASQVIPGSYANQAKIIHCDIDPSEVDKNIKSDVAIIADLKETLQCLIPRVKENSHSSLACRNLKKLTRLNMNV